MPDAADDAASASSPVLSPLALETVDQSCHCVTGEEDITEGPPQSLGISAKVSFFGTCGSSTQVSVEFSLFCSRIYQFLKPGPKGG